MTPGPSICARPGKSVARDRVPVVVRHGLSPPVLLCRSRQSVARNRRIRAADAFPIEHLTRSRAVSRVHESFSCRFLSSLVGERPPDPFMLFRLGLWLESHGEPSRLHTPCRDSLSATPVPISYGVVGSVRVNACPSVRSLCSRKTICPEKMAIERPEARRVPTGHLAFGRHASRHRWRTGMSQDVGIDATSRNPGPRREWTPFR